jgi:transposase-like protein
MVGGLVLKPKTPEQRNTRNRPKQNNTPINLTKQDLLRLLTQDDALKSLLQTLLQEVLEAEMDTALHAGKGERTDGRLGYGSGHYPRTLVTRVGKLELRVPQDREGRFSNPQRRAWRRLWWSNIGRRTGASFTTGITKCRPKLS